MMRTITFKIEEDLLELLDSYAKRLGRPRSAVIRKAIEEYLYSRTNRPKWVGTRRIRVVYYD